MPKSKLTVSFFLPTTSFSRIKDAMDAIVVVLEKEHKARDLFASIEGPYADEYSERVTDYGKRTPSDGGESRVGRTGDDNRGAGSAGNGSAGSAASTDAAAPKRRGRPPGSKTRAGEAAERGGEGDDRSTGNAQDADRNELQRARQNAESGRGEGASRDDGAGRGGSTGSRGQSAAGLNNVEIDDDWGADDTTEENGDDWGDDDTDNSKELTPAEAVHLPNDEWPLYLIPDKLDKTVLNSLLGDHYRATGGKDRGLTLDILEKAGGARQISQVAERDYPKLAQFVLKDIARYEYGLKKAK